MPLPIRSEEHTSELQSHDNLVCRLLLEKKKEHDRARRKHEGTGRGRAPRAADRWRAARCVHRTVGAWAVGPAATPARLFVFFFKDPATPKFSLFPLPAAFRT